MLSLLFSRLFNFFFISISNRRPLTWNDFFHSLYFVLYPSSFFTQSFILCSLILFFLLFSFALHYSPLPPSFIFMFFLLFYILLSTISSSLSNNFIFSPSNLKDLSCFTTSTIFISLRFDFYFQTCKSSFLHVSFIFLITFWHFLSIHSFFFFTNRLFITIIFFISSIHISIFFTLLFLFLVFIFFFISCFYSLSLNINLNINLNIILCLTSSLNTTFYFLFSFYYFPALFPPLWRHCFSLMEISHWRYGDHQSFKWPLLAGFPETIIMNAFSSFIEILQ